MQTETIRRNCPEVIRQIAYKVQWAEIDQEIKEKFINKLSWHYDDATYKAPEDNLQWSRLSETLAEYIHLDTTSPEWMYEVISIFNTQEISEIKKDVFERVLQAKLNKSKS